MQHEGSEVDDGAELHGTGLHGAGLHLVRGVAAEQLAGVLGARLAAAPPEDPFAPIEVAVPSVGMARWLSQRLSHQLGATDQEGGVAAGLTLPFLGQVIASTVSATLDGQEHTDPWPPEQLQWSILERLDTLSDDPVYAPLHAHLTEGTVRADRRRLPLARRIAELFDRYALHRPDMLGRWQEGVLVDAADEPLPTGLRWQPALWQELSRGLELPSPDRRVAAAVAALRGDATAPGAVARPQELPGPVIVFGVLTMPSMHLELLAALAAHTRVDLYVLAPVPAWWERRDRAAVTSRPAHPLLAASGWAAWEASASLAEVVASRAATVTDLDPAGSAVYPVSRPQPEPVSRPQPGPRPEPQAQRVLTTLQADLRADRRRGRDAAVPLVRLDPRDNSLQVHACHGPVRQLEVLREVLLGLLEDDPRLEPRDVVVLTPDIATYAPLVASAFPSVGPEDDSEGPPVLPVRVADRTVRPGNHVAEALDRVLVLATSRVGGSEVLDLLGTPPLRARFQLRPDDLALLTDWVLGTGVSWGIDRAHRRELVDLDDGAHTWSAGLDRLALGAAMPDDGVGVVNGLVPYDDVEGSGVEQLGRVLTATDALFAVLRELQTPRTAAAWYATVAAALTTLCDPGDGPGRDASLTEDLAAVRDDLARLLDVPDVGAKLTLEEVRWLLTGALGDRGGSTPYGTGAVTVSGLKPLRNLPHRVVCLVGMDDAALPSAPQEQGFDLLAADPRPGDPDPRVEDRQLFLDALLAARDHLVITYTGHDPRTNEITQPAAPVSELLDVLEETVLPVGSGGTVRDHLVIDHPLQPYSARYFRPEVPGTPPQAFDLRQLAAARAAQGDRVAVRGFLERPLPDAGAEVVDPGGVELAEVVTAVQHPLRTLLQRRLGLRLGEDDRRLEDRDPTELTGVHRWQVSQQLLEQRLSATHGDRWRDRLMATGTVPVGGLGVVALEGVEERVAAVTAALAAAPGPEQVVGIDLLIDLPSVAGSGPRGGPIAEVGQLRLTGSVPLTGARLVTAQMANLKAKHRLAAWVRLLAVAAMRPDLAVEAVLIGPPPRGSQEATTSRLQLGALVADGNDAELGLLARRHLGVLIDLYLRAHITVVPLLPETSRALVLAGRKGREDPVDSHDVRTAWQGSPAGRGRSSIPGERDDAYVVQALGPDVELGSLLDDHPGLEGEMARVWEPILAAEVDQ